jgi:hypothetical protein
VASDRSATSHLTQSPVANRNWLKSALANGVENVPASASLLALAHEAC